MKCRWCDFQPITIRKDGSARIDLDGQMLSHVSRAHAAQARSYWHAVKCYARDHYAKLGDAYRRAR